MDIRPVGEFGHSSPAPQPVAAAPVQASTAARVNTANPVRQPAAAPSRDELAEAVKHINKTMETIATGIEFSVDEDLHATVVKVVDQNTKEVLRQMPSAETLEIAKALDKLQGLLIRQQA
jgi:flagellar protein FlaG